MSKLLSILPFPLLIWVANLTQDHPHGPPPEAFTACTSKAAGDACTVAFRGSSLEGTCKTSSDRKLFCLPTNMPLPPEGDGGAPPGPPPSN